MMALSAEEKTRSILWVLILVVQWVSMRWVGQWVGVVSVVLWLGMAMRLVFMT